MFMVCTGGFCVMKLLGSFKNSKSTWEASDSAEAPEIGWDHLQLPDICLCYQAAALLGLGRPGSGSLY